MKYMQADWGDPDEREDDREAISSNHFSLRDQTYEALSFLEHYSPQQFLATHLYFFGEEVEEPFDALVSAMDEDPESDALIEVIDAIEWASDIFWEDGEPWITVEAAKTGRLS